MFPICSLDTVDSQAVSFTAMSRNDIPSFLPERIENQPLDLALLHRLTEDELDAAPDEGLGGNGQYQDLQACDICDLRAAVAHEGAALNAILSAPDNAAAEELYRSNRPENDERSALWHLDPGVAAATIALVTIGAHPVLSCNGGVFGTPHTFQTPVVSLYLDDADPHQLIDLANRSGIRVTVSDGKIFMRADRIEAFHHMACRILGEHDATVVPT